MNANAPSPTNGSPATPAWAKVRGDVIVLTLIVVGLWLLVLWPAYALGDRHGLIGASIAAVLCLVPGWLVFAAIGLYGVAASPTKQVGIGLALRMVFVLGGFLAVKTAFPQLGTREFTVWLLVFYLATLAIETRQLMQGLADSSESPAGQPDKGTGNHEGTGNQEG